MSNGAFVWYELGTTDPAAAASFYHKVVGWDAQPVPEMHYTVLTMQEARVAGMMQLPEHVLAKGVPPHWVGYIHVDDVDAYTKRAEEAGATLRHGPDDIPGIGRFAVLTDPAGAPFNLFKTNGAGGPEVPFMTPGHIGWHELMAPSGEKAFDFYSGLFGWTRGEAMPMGEMGVYQIFKFGGRDQGGIMRAPQGAHPFWTFYFVVSGIDAAQRRVTEAGGQVRNGPMEVPGGAWILQCLDPQGAFFAMVSATR